MSRGIASVAVAAALLLMLGACSDQPTVATPPSPANELQLDAIGPAFAPKCAGVTVTPEQDPQQVIDQHPAATTFCFSKGLHRITSAIRPGAGATLASSEGAVLTGSIPLTTWRRDGEYWVARGALPAAYQLKGQCEDNKTNPCRPGEQLFVNGKHLTRVMSRDAVKPGTFFGDYATNAIYVADDVRKLDVELSRTETAIDKSATDVTITGLTIEHFASKPQGGALQVGTGWKVSDNEVRWNHAVGIMIIQGDKAVLQRNVVADNGQLGIGQYSSAGVRITENLVTRNNTDGFWIADWESGGIKSTRSSGEVSRNEIVANRGIGMWSDIAEYDRVIKGNRIKDNAADGIRYEISYQAVIEQNTVEGNGFGTGRNSGPSLWDGGGININTSSEVRVTGNLIRGNRNGISIQSRTRGDGPRGRYVLRDIVIESNQVVMDSETASTGVVENKNSPAQDGAITFSRNTYRIGDQQAERFAYRGRTMTWTQWQAAGFDKDSVSS